MTDIDNLIGAELDAAVALALGKKHVAISPDGLRCWAGVNHQDQDGGFFTPSTDWRHGGPIIERERISVHSVNYGADNEWEAGMNGVHSYDGWECDHEATGPTVLVAAMRTFVKSRNKT